MNTSQSTEIQLLGYSHGPTGKYCDQAWHCLLRGRCVSFTARKRTEYAFKLTENSSFGSISLRTTNDYAETNPLRTSVCN